MNDKDGKAIKSNYSDQRYKTPSKRIKLHTEKDPKKPKKEEKKFVNSGDLKSLLKEPAENMKFKDFDTRIYILIAENRKYPGLEAKIYALMCKDIDKFTEFKYDETEPKKCLWEWVCDFQGSDDDKNTLNGFRYLAIDEGKNLCYALIDLMFFMSSETLMHEQMLETFLVLEIALEWVLDGENSVVIRSVLEILRNADKIIRKKKQDDIEENSDSGKEKIVMEEEYFTDKFMFALLKEIFRLELIWMHHRLSVSQDSLIGAIQLLKSDFDEIRESLDQIASDITESFNEEDVQCIIYSNAYLDVKGFSTEIWDTVLL